MAYTSLTADEIIEYWDTEEELVSKVERLAKLIQNAQHFVTYTGAGISTAAGIPDFRGPDGVWTAKAQGKQAPARVRDPQPTLTHMALVSLMEAGHLRYLVSQNCDGLHLKSGIPPESISELHGNGFVEACAACGKVYYRTSRVRSAQNKWKLTGRRCDDCNTPLRYSSVSFQQSMPDLSLSRAEKQSRECDLSLCLGTSMTVSPACELPMLGRKKLRAGHTLCIVNLQKTPYDDKCGLRIFARVETVMEMLFQHLSFPIKDYSPLNIDQAWIQNFQANYVFRSPADDWFIGPVFWTEEMLNQQRGFICPADEADVVAADLFAPEEKKQKAKRLSL